VTVRRAALVSALAAALLYLPALGNRFALDDGPIVERNPRAHSVGAALAAFDQPYWPPEAAAGLWRPLVILSFAADWQASGGNPAWLHATNVVLHAAATALVVLVVAPYVGAAGALAGGLLFAVHPLHVEAVANLVGRAEMMVACFLLLAVLVARKVRERRAAGRATAALEAALFATVLAALLSKEHAVIAVALLWLDDRAREAPGRLPVRDYVVIAVMSVVWFVLRRAVEGDLSFQAIAPTFFPLDTVGRISTMLPAALVVLRLLVWPFDLSPDYHPMVIERLTHPTAAGALGLLMIVTLAVLALALWRRHRPWSLGLLVIGLAWLPTANLLFPSGIVLAERTLYLPSVGLALLAALAADVLVRRAGVRRAAMVGLVVAVPLAARTVTRVPAWRSTRDLVVTALLEHPESYKVHQSAARVLWRLGLHEEALTEYRVAREIYPLDHYLLAEIGSAELDAGHVRAAVEVLRNSDRLDSNYTLTQQLLAQAYLRLNDPVVALGYARRAVATGPTSAEAARMLAASYLALRQPDSAMAVWPAFVRRGGDRFDRWLLGAVTLASIGRIDSAAVAMDSAEAAVPDDSIARRRLADARREIDRLRAGP